MKKILLVFGTRPEAIKMAPVVIEFKKHENEFNTVVCVTGQHRQMLDQILNFFEIIPDYDLNIMKSNQDLYDLFTTVLNKLKPILRKEKPDMVFVHGDTSTSTAAALSAFYEQIPVAHVEAGLRTDNIYSPWPEEMNRQITGRIASLHFAPTELPKNNLIKENIAKNKIIVTGNTVIDALQYTIQKIKTTSGFLLKIKDDIAEKGYLTDRISQGKKLILITGHRRENIGEGFKNICLAIKELASKYNNIDFLYPVHLNPDVRKTVFNYLSDLKTNNIFLIDPLDYLSFIFLLERSFIVLTDSGGIQEEAPDFGKPVLVMRDTTERQEALNTGTVLLVGTDRTKIVSLVCKLIEDTEFYANMSKKNNPYGDGQAATRIVNYILSKI